MATLVACTVDPDGTGDYLSLNAANADYFGATSDNLVSNDEYVVCTCTSSGGSADTTGISVGTMATDATRNITIQADDGHEAVKSSWDTSRYRLHTTDTTTLAFSSNNVIISGLQLREDYSATAHTHCVRINAITSAGEQRLKNCRIQSNGAGYVYGISIPDADADAFIENTIVYNCHRQGIYGSGGTVVIYNSIICGVVYEYGIRQSAGTITVKNTAVFDTPNDFYGTFTMDYIASDDDHSGDCANYWTGPSGSDWDNEFNDPSNGDFTLLNTGNLYNHGIGPGSDASVPTTDIDGDTRSGATCDIGVDEYLVSGGLTLTCDVGTVTVSGAAAGLTASRLLSGATGIVTASGEAAGFLVNRLISTEPGTITVEGQAAGLTASRLLSCDYGIVTAEGQDVGLLTERVLTLSADLGTVMVSGEAAGLLAHRVLSASLGTVTVSGQDVGLNLGGIYILAMGAGTTIVEGQAAGLYANRLLTGAVGNVTVSGEGAGLYANRILTAGAGQAIISGQDATLLWQRILSAETGSYLVSGESAALQRILTLLTEAGAATVSGQDAALLWHHILNGELGTLTINGQAVDLRIGGRAITTPTSRTIIIAAENRTIIIPAESRIIVIPS